MRGYRELNNRTASMIHWLVDRMHCGRALDEVGREILDRVRGDDSPENRAASRTLVAEAILCARRRHLENRELFASVMGGRSR